MDALIIVMRILHIVFSVFWVGTAFFMVVILAPKLKALGPQIQSPVMKSIMPVMMPYMFLSSSITVLSGIVLTLVMRWGVLGTLFTTGWGWSMIVGFVTSLAAAIIAFGVVVPIAKRQAALASSIEGRPPSPEEGKQLGQLGAKIGALTLNNFVLVIIATITMAIARFV